MKAVAELVSVLSLLATMAGVLWAGFGLIAADPMTGYDPADTGFMSGGMKFAAISAVVFIAAGIAKKRMG